MRDATESRAGAWWVEQPYAKLLSHLSHAEGTAGVIAWHAGGWSTAPKRAEVWAALHRLAEAGLVVRSNRTWSRTGALERYVEARRDEFELYDGRLKDKAIEVGEFDPDGAAYFCGSCCYAYDDVVEPDTRALLNQCLDGVVLGSGEIPPVDRRMAREAWRSAIGDSSLAIPVAILVVLALPLGAVAIAIYLAWLGVTGAGRALARAMRAFHR